MSGLSGPPWDEAPIPFERTLDGMLGFEVLEMREDFARGRVLVTDRVRQMWGLVHGGVYSALSEMLASEAAVSSVHGEGRRRTLESYELLRSVFEGTIHAEARRMHRTTWLWEVSMTDDDGRLCAVSRVALAIRSRP